MATWKRFTGAVDSSAQSFLKNKRFSREKKKFTWDWHAWNLALVSTPSVLLAYYLHGVGKRMYEEAAIREEIQERTGVSSRGFLIPKREVREEVLGMLSAGNQPGAATGGEDVEKEVQDGKDNPGRDIPGDFESIQRRLAAIESMLGVQGDSSSAERVGVEDGAGSGSHTSSKPGDVPVSREGGELATAKQPTSTADDSGAEAEQGQSILDRAAERAAAAGAWVAATAERQGKRLLRTGRDWLAKDDRQEGSTDFGNSRLIDEGEHRADTEINAAEVQSQEEEPAGKTLGGVRPRNAAGAGDDNVANDGKGNAEGAWRSGRLGGSEKQR